MESSGVGSQLSLALATLAVNSSWRPVFRPQLEQTPFHQDAFSPLSISRGLLFLPFPSF